MEFKTIGCNIHSHPSGAFVVGFTMDRRQLIITAVSANLFAATAIGATQSWRLGIVASAPLRPIKRFKAKMEQLGYVPGLNISYLERYADGNDNVYPTLLSEIIQSNVDVLVVWGTPAAFAAKRATSITPIVLGSVGDVTHTGIVSNLAHPEGNITGCSAVNVDLEGKRFETLRELIPGIRKISVVSNINNPLSRYNLGLIKEIGRTLGVNTAHVDVANGDRFQEALSELRSQNPDAAIIASDTLLLARRQEIVRFMEDIRVPAIYPFREYAEAGGLIVQGADLSILFERAAGYVDRILKGARPQDLPVQQATAFELILNTKAADRLGINFGPMLISRADELID